MPAIAPGTSRSLLALCLGLVWVVWGSVYLGIRLVIDEVDVFQAMAQRFALAGALLLTIAVLRRGRGVLRMDRRQAASLILTGVLLLGLGNGLQALGQSTGLPSGVTALIVAAVPAWAVLLRLAIGERPARPTLVGVVLGFLGIVVLVLLGRGASGPMPVAGVVLTLGSSVAWTLGSYLQGVLDLPEDLVALAGYQQLVACCSSTVLALATGEHFSVDYSARGWSALIYLVVACSAVGFLAFGWLLTHVPLSLTATHAYVNPMVAVLLGWLVLGEQVGVPVLLGGAIIVGSVVLVLAAERSPQAPAERLVTESSA